LLIPGSGCAQLIKGTVLDSNQKPISAQVLIKDASDPLTISEFVLTKNGKFEYLLKKDYSKNGVLLEVIATGYSILEKSISPENLGGPLEFRFILIKERILALDEVVLEGAKKPYKRKKDTVVFNAQAYLDGTEKKVEDLLRKLPGIEVNEENGIIKYKGKSIETVTIEGDNLFDYNYATATKNINVDIIEEIEAIENYSENHLLKGIEKSNKIALNLKIKESKTDLSASLDIGYGDFPDNAKNSSSLSLSLLAINKKHKTLALGSLNNIGRNDSPFNYFTNEITAEQLNDKRFITQKIIPEFGLSRLTKNNLSNINDQKFANYNSIFRISNRISAKVNLYFVNDRLNTRRRIENRFIVNNSVFNTFDNNILNKEPTKYRGDLEFKINTSESSLLEYNISLRDDIIETDNTIFSNQANNFVSNLTSQSLFIKHHLELTKRLEKKNAFQFRFINTSSDLDQVLQINPSVIQPDGYNEDIQTNTSSKTNTSLSTLFIGKFGKNIDYKLTLGLNLDKERFNSLLKSLNTNEQLELENETNDVKLDRENYYFQSSFNWRIGKFSIFPRFPLRNLRQQLSLTNLNLSTDNVLFEPSVGIAYQINRNSVLSFNYSLNQNAQAVQNLFQNQVLISNRLISNNEPNINLQKNELYSISYSKNDLFNQLEIAIGGNYLKQKGNFFSNTRIDENATRITNFFLNENTENYSAYIVFSKLINALKTNLRITSNYSVSKFNNVVNESELRDNIGVLSINSISFKTAFLSSINFENKFSFNFQEFNSQSSFVNKQIENTSRLLIKPSNHFLATISYNYVIPNIQEKSNRLSFLSTRIFFKPKNRKWELELAGINLLNEDLFIERNTSDISTDIIRTKLLGRYYNLGFSYSF
jgi:hypothetical protein